MAGEEELRADPRVVTEFHTHADTDTGQEAIHHTLGPGVNQASPGSHRHDGTDSPALIMDRTITGSKEGNTALASVIAILVELGATDGTT